MPLFSKFFALRALAVLAAFFGLVVASDAAFAGILDGLSANAQIDAAKHAVEELVKVLAGVAVLLLVGRAVLRALQIRF